MQWDKVHNRLTPKAGPEHFKSYAWRAPIETHWRRGTCEEYECAGYLNGFVTTVDVGTDLGRKQYYFLTHDKTRKPSIQRVSERLIKFVYAPGNRCMSYGDHRVPIGKPPLLLVLGGDWRGNPRNLRTVVHRSMENWVEDFALHQDKIAEVVGRG